LGTHLPDQVPDLIEDLDPEEARSSVDLKAVEIEAAAILGCGAIDLPAACPSSPPRFGMLLDLRARRYGENEVRSLAWRLQATAKICGFGPSSLDRC
jgi:hypothetical protein